jgi:hypothetical protein
MSRQIALDSIALRPTPRWGHTEYSLGYHPEYFHRLTGVDPSSPDFERAINDAWEVDFIWSINDGLHSEWFTRGRATNMGHAVYASDGVDFVQTEESPFTSVEEVWAFDAVAEYGLPDFAEQVAAYETTWCARQAANPNQLLTGGYYRTIISGAIQAFGWEMLLEAASDLTKFERVLDSIYRFTRFHVEAWAQTSAEVFIQHDDFVWTSGAFLRPDFYRQAIIPRYAELWKILHAAGKKVIFCSDGTFTEFAEDIAAAGADGFSFEPSNPFAFMVERFGASHVLIGSAVDVNDMAFGTWEDVRASLDRTLQLAESCRGLILCVGNHLVPNVSDAMKDNYFDYLTAHWHRNAVTA